MGIVVAKSDPKFRRDNKTIKDAVDPTVAEPELSEREANLLREIWKNIPELLEDVGVIAFVR